MSMLTDELKEFGLNSSEIKVYLHLLDNDICTPPQIARGTGIARTNCYHLLRDLSEKGLIREHRRGLRKAYLANDPEAMLRVVDQKREVVARLVPDIRARMHLQANKPGIRFYNGIEEVKEIFIQLRSAKEVIAIGSTAQLFPHDRKFFDNNSKEMKKRGIMFRDILTSASGKEMVPAAKEILKGHYETKLIPEIYGDVQTDILIWNDSIALIAVNEPVFGTVIVNQELARTFRIVFDLLWKMMK